MNSALMGGYMLEPLLAILAIMLPLGLAYIVIRLPKRVQKGENHKGSGNK